MPEALQGSFTSTAIAERFAAAHYGSDLPEIFIDTPSEDAAVWGRINAARESMSSI